MAIGISFIPPQPGTSAGQPDQAAQALQQAIKILSLRLPTNVTGAGAVAPQALLQGQGGGGLTSAASSGAVGGVTPGASGIDIDRLIQQILAGLLPQQTTPGVGLPAPVAAQPGQAAPASPFASLLTPRVIPGTEAPRQPLPSAQMPPTAPTGPLPTMPQTQASQTPVMSGGGGGGLETLFGPKRRGGSY